VFIDSLGPNP